MTLRPSRAATATPPAPRSARPPATPATPATPASLAPEPTDPASALRAWLAVVQAYHLCDAVLAERLAAVGLRTAEHEVLLVLQRASGLTQQQLARRCLVAKSGISVLVARLEAVGWLERSSDEADARVKRLHLTAEGQRRAAQAHAVQAAVVAAMVAGTSEAELATVGQAMARASAALQALRDAAPLRGAQALPRTTRS